MPPCRQGHLEALIPNGIGDGTLVLGKIYREKIPPGSLFTDPPKLFGVCRDIARA